VKHTHDGLTLWYGTPDAPAPLGDVVSPSAASLVVGVNPTNPSNVVHAKYRVDGGVIQIAAGRLLRTDDAHQTQYFVVPFPILPPGSVVEYGAALGCVGRQVPAPGTAERLPSTFSIAAAPAPTARPASAADPANAQRMAPRLEFLAAVTVRVDRPLCIGETPEGVRFDFFAIDGTASGPRMNGRVLSRSSDHLFVRPDGVAVLRVRAMIETNDGAMLEVEYTGSLDFGPDGYKRALANDLPTRATYVVAPRYLTAHPRYRWLNRLQCLGVGRIRLDESIVEYDAFGVGVITLDAGDGARPR
jgi:hypothetical protein